MLAGSSTLGLAQLPNHPGSMMSARTATLQMGYLLGGLIGGATLAWSGYAAHGIIIAADLVLCAALVLRVNDPPLREVAEPAVAAGSKGGPTGAFAGIPATTLLSARLREGGAPARGLLTQRLRKCLLIEVRIELRGVAGEAIPQGIAEWRSGEQEMMQPASPYSTTNWFVMAGSEEEFVSRWMVLAEWVMNNVPGAKSAVLIRSTDDFRRFLSIVTWETQQAWEAWRERFETQELFERCRELCEELEVHAYTLAASTSR